MGQVDSVLELYADAVREQLKMLESRCEAGAQLAGWKLAFTSGEARDRYDYRPFGYILLDNVFSAGVALSLSSVPRCVLEGEIALVLRESLEGDCLTRKRVLAAIDGVAPAFEINSLGRPVADMSTAIATNLAQWGVVIGGIKPASQVDLDMITATVSTDSVTVGRSAVKGFLDDPIESLCRLAADLSACGRSLRAGDLIMTGALTTHRVDRAGDWCADFGSLGSVTLRFY
jgi:2-keto-4-pentenoate hydratase